MNMENIILHFVIGVILFLVICVVALIITNFVIDHKSKKDMDEFVYKKTKNNQYFYYKRTLINDALKKLDKIQFLLRRTKEVNAEASKALSENDVDAARTWVDIYKYLNDCIDFEQAQYDEIEAQINELGEIPYPDYD